MKSPSGKATLFKARRNEATQLALGLTRAGSTNASDRASKASKVEIVGDEYPRGSRHHVRSVEREGMDQRQPRGVRMRRGVNRKCDRRSVRGLERAIASV
jgi:hypothetical protein